MEDDLDLIDTSIYHPTSPVTPTLPLLRPSRQGPEKHELVELAEEEDVDPSLIVLPRAPVPPEGKDDLHSTPEERTNLPVQPESDEKTCRICFGGEDEEDELGRLFSPCVCRGTSSHVHVKCLTRWRTMSANKTAFWSCSQCHFKYHFARTRVVGIATNPVAITLTTLILFLTLTLLSGHLLHLFLHAYIPVPSSLGDPQIPPASFAEILLDDPPDLGLVRYAPTSTAFEIVRGAVGVFAGGEAEEVLKGLWTLVVDAFAYLSGNEDKEAERSVMGQWVKVVKGWFSSFLSLVYQNKEPSGPPSYLSHYNPLNSGLIHSLVYRFTLGISLIGSLSFISLLLSLSLLPLFSLFNTYNLPRFATLGRRGRRARTQAGGGGGPGLGAVVMVVMVGIGIVRTLLGLYNTIQGWSAKLLHRAETAILEVSTSGEELDPDASKEKAAGRVGQRVVWEPPGGWGENEH